MKNSEYWKLRFEQLEKSQNKLAEMSKSEIEGLYRQAVKDIEGKIDTWYRRLAANNGVSMAEARKMLSASELKEFKWDVYDYIKYGQENALSGQWIKQLENASAKFHISKYEALKIQTRQSLESLFAKQSTITSDTMKDIYQSGYYHTAFEIQKGFGVGWDISGVDQNQLEKVIAKPWAVDGKNFSERIWSNKQKLIAEVHNELTQNIITGADPQKAINAIASKLNASKSNAGRLVMTEEAYFSSAAQKNCFDDLGVEEYEIVATLDAHTSEICQSMDGKHFPMKNFQAGVTAPPFHPWCRSTTCPWFDDDFGDVGERAARREDGKTYYVPADMTYGEWKESFVDGGDKSGLVKPETNKQRNFDNTKAYSEVQDEYQKNAKPKQGNITYDEGYDKEQHKNEVIFADWLYNKFGGNIKLLNESCIDNVKTPDYIWNDKLWDLKTVTTEKGANSAVRKGLHQIELNPGGIFLDYGDRDILIDVLLNVIEERMKWHKGEGFDIMIIQNGEVIKVLRYEKRA